MYAINVLLANYKAAHFSSGGEKLVLEEAEIFYGSASFLKRNSKNYDKNPNISKQRDGLYELTTSP
jgi:hypothetical protein